MGIDELELLFGQENFQMMETLILDKVYLYLEQSFSNMTISMMRPMGGSTSKKQSSIREKDEQKKVTES